MSSKPIAIGCACALLAFAVPRQVPAETLRADSVLREAIEKNPSLRAAVSDLAAAQASTASESARYDPTLTVSLGATHTKSPSLSPGSSSVLVGTSDVAQADATLSKTLAWGTQVYASVGSTASRSSTPFLLGSAQGGSAPLLLTVGPGYLFSAKVGVTQPLLRGAGREVTLAPYYQAASRENASQRERDRQASALARDVLVAYWELWYASKAIEVDRRAHETAKAQRDDAMARMNTGSLARADVLTFETQLSTKEETLLQTELERSTRESELARLLGRDRVSELALSEAEPPTPNDISGELVERALLHSPDVASKDAAVSVAEVGERTAADAYRPKLDLDAWLQAQGLGNDDVPGAFSQLAGFGVLSAHVGLTLELPLTGTRRRSEASRARAETDTARNNLDATRKEVTSEVTTTIRKRDLARKRIELAAASAKYAEQQLTAQQALFASGSGTALQVVQAQDNVQAANKRLGRARADLVQAHLALSHLVGGLLAEATALVPKRTTIAFGQPLLGVF